MLGCAVFAAVELIATVLLAPGEVRFATLLRLAALSISLAAVGYLVVAPALWAAALGARLVVWLRSPEAEARYRGLLRPVPGQKSGPDTRAARLWAATIAAGIYVGASAFLTYFFQTHFNAPLVVAVVLGGLQLVLIAACAIVWMGLSRGLRALALGPASRLGKKSPLGNLALAAGLILACALGALLAVAAFIPQLRPLIPWRYMLAAAACFAGIRGAVALLAHRDRLLPSRATIRRIAIAAGALALFTALTLWKIGADPATKYLAVTGSPPLQSLIDLVRAANDFDGDGYGSLLGENDCYPFNDQRHRGARDIPDNGIDENCSGADFSLKVPPSYRTGDTLPVPAAYDRPYNILLITIDTLRYDHTGLGGYEKKSGRDTTPNLDELATGSVSFSFANAPSAGTMASVPAILTSKFFHSGIALDEDVPPHTPPIIKPENVLLSEILKGAGYDTGAIVSHYYFNNWNMDQGFDDFINMNPKRTPFRVTSHIITDLGLQWISKHIDSGKWFLWIHYIDPHGRYVGHPGAQYGETEMDLYDSEIHYTDKHIGRLLRGLQRMPVADNTVIIVTSDHGDGFKEHGFINHGMALYRELLHVPLIIHVPNNEPRVVDGPVSPLDIVPTVAQLAGADVSGLSFEGQSLIPQLFYGRDARSRIVFSETNWPRPLRAAISDKYKLVFHLKNNVYELYNLKKDPWEQDNIHSQDRRGLETMKRYLDDWLERVYYARDFTDNQAIATLKAKGILRTEPPTPAYPVKGVSFLDGTIEVVGFDVAPGKKNRLEVSVYFHTRKRPPDTFRFRVWAYPATAKKPGAPAPMRSRLGEVAGGLFPTVRWRPGEYVRHRATLRLPHDFAGGRWMLGLEMRKKNEVIAPSLPLSANKDAGGLGEIVLDFAAAGDTEGSKGAARP